MLNLVTNICMAQSLIQQPMDTFKPKNEYIITKTKQVKYINTMICWLT